MIFGSLQAVFDLLEMIVVEEFSELFSIFDLGSTTSTLSVPSGFVSVKKKKKKKKKI